MVGLLLLAFLAVPIIELAVIVQVAQGIGVGNTIVLLILISIVGAWLAKHEGIGVVRRFFQTLERGDVPAREVVDGALILFAGALMLTPGFVTDLLAIFLLVPPTRALVRTALLRRYRGRIEFRRAGRFGTPFGTQGDEVWEAESWEQPGRPQQSGLPPRELDG